MKSKKLRFIFINLVLLCLFSTATISALSTSNPETEYFEITTKEHELDIEETIQIDTTGPIWQVFPFVDITFIDGPILKITLIARLLSSRNLYLMLPKLPIKVTDISFSVKYRINTPKLPILRRFTYETIINEDGNQSNFTAKHTLIVSDFNGQFILYRAKPLRLTPAYFRFTGSCKDIIIS